MNHARLQVICDPDFTEILIAEIAEAGFDMFMETDKGFEAHGEESKVNTILIDQIKAKYHHVKPLIFFQDKIQKKNWNVEWEKNVDPIIVENQCLVRAAFHTIREKYPYEIIITPKMSFGTGHHQTTYLMLKSQLLIDHAGKRVMDAGCGTAILSIMASKRGAKEVEAFDTDDWSMENGRENVALNKCNNIRIQKGSIAELSWTSAFDIILANINKNVLLGEMKWYAGHLRQGGILLLSGFYSTDIDDLMSEAESHHFKLISRDQRDKWAAIHLEKTL